MIKVSNNLEWNVLSISFNDSLHISKYLTWKSFKLSFMSRLLWYKILFGIKNDMFQVLLSLKTIWRKKIITFKQFLSFNIFCMM